MKLVKEPIKLPTTYTIPAVSIKNRDKLIAKSKVIGNVSNIATQTLVAENSRQLRTLVKDAKAVCAPILKAIKAAGDAVRKLQNDYIGPVGAEQARCEQMLVEFDAKEKQRVAAEQTARQAEIERLQAVAKAAEQKATLDTPEALQADLEAHDAQQAMESLILAPTPEPAKPKGVSIQERLRYEVLDIHQVYAARPDLVRLELNAAEVLRVCVPELPVPGLKLWYEKTAETRAA